MAEPDAVAERWRKRITAGLGADAGALLRFCHDQIAQAALLLRDDAWRAGLRLAMARRFAQSADAPLHRSHAAGHYAAAVALIRDDTERATARRLFVEAALRARHSGAFAVAEHFVRLSVSLLPDHAWQCAQAETLSLHCELHLLLCCQSRQEPADEVFALIMAAAPPPLDLVDAT